MPQRWAIRFAIDGDLRFLSHHDVMRAMERLAGRASLPLRYTQGFNPHPVLSLPCPRPVGVASRDDLLVISLEEELSPPAVLEPLNAQAPRGMVFLSAAVLATGTNPRVRHVAYEVPVAEENSQALRKRLDDLGASPAWPVQRRGGEDRRGNVQTRTIDIRPLVSSLQLDAGRLSIRLAPQGDLWARPGEVLWTVGLDEQLDLCRTTRTEVMYE